MPVFIPETFGFGRYKVQSPATYSYVSEFVDIDVTEAPNSAVWRRKLAHMQNISRSPTGKFGFPVTTCDGKMAHTVDREENWVLFF